MSDGEAAEAHGGLLELLSMFESEEDLEHAISDLVGRRSLPPRPYSSVREWLEALLAFLEHRSRAAQWEAGFNEPPQVRARRLRPRVVIEAARIGAHELAERTGVDLAELQSFMSGGTPAAPVLNAFEFYDFREYPDLRRLMEGYFYEGYDFDSEPHGWRPVLQRFAAAETAGLVRGVVADLATLLNRVNDEAGLQRVLDDFGCYLVPERVGLTSREWLEAVRRELVRLTGDAIPERGPAAL